MWSAVVRFLRPAHGRTAAPTDSAAAGSQPGARTPLFLRRNRGQLLSLADYGTGKSLTPSVSNALALQHVYGLESIYRYGPETTTERVEFGRGQGKEIKAGVPGDGLPFITERESNSEKARYRLLNQFSTRSNGREGIRRALVGRRTDIDLTNEGKNTLSVFRHLIEP